MSDEKKNEEPIKKADKAFKDVLAGVRLGTDEEIAERDAEIARMETERLKESRESMFLRSGIAEKLKSVNLSELLESGLAEMKDTKGNVISDIKIFENFISDIVSGKPRVLLFFGEYGTGKTVFAAALMHEVCRRGVSSAYYKAHEIMQRLDDVKWHLSHETRVGIMNEICSPKFRVIDEIGRYPDEKNEQFILFDITNRCYETFKSSIYISNLTKKELGEFMGGAIIDRFRGFGMTIEFSGKSFRGTEEELYTK